MVRVTCVRVRKADGAFHKVHSIVGSASVLAEGLGPALVVAASTVAARTASPSLTSTFEF